MNIYIRHDENIYGIDRQFYSWDWYFKIFFRGTHKCFIFHGPLHLVCVALLHSGSTAEDKTKIEVNRYDLRRTDRHRECTKQGGQKKNNNKNNSDNKHNNTNKERNRCRAGDWHTLRENSWKCEIVFQLETYPTTENYFIDERYFSLLLLLLLLLISNPWSERMRVLVGVGITWLRSDSS